MTTLPKNSVEQPRRPRSGFRRLFRLLMVVVVLPYLGVLVLLVVFQRSLLYPASQVDSLPVSRVTTFPQDRLRDVEIETADGIVIRGWLFLTDSIDGQPKDEISGPPLVLVFHGNGGNRGSRVPIATEFIRQGCDVLLIDYRGYGDSEGSPSREGLVQDAIATWSYAVDALGRAPEHIILFGESLGGAVAVELACHCCRNHSSPAGLLVASTFASLPDTAARTYPMFPVWWVVRDRFVSRDLIPAITCPIVQVHGRLDELVALEEAEELFAAAPATSSTGIPKRFVVLEDADHNNVPEHTLGQELGEMMRGR